MSDTRLKAMLFAAACFTSMHAALADAGAALLAWAGGAGATCSRVGDVELYTNGADKFEALFADLRQARRSIDVEYFIYADDSIATLMTDLLVQKAAEGVRVRLVVDDYKAHVRRYAYATPAGLDSLRRLGIDITMFDPWRFPYVNHLARDHRKIVVVDDSVAYIGGLNVADYYVRGCAATYGAWRDTHLRLTGDAVGVLRESFGQIAGLSAPGEAAPPRDGDDFIFVERSRASRAKKAETRRAYVAAFDAAERKIQIVDPYLLPTRSVRRAMQRALDRGVQMEILLSAESDEPTINLGVVHFAHSLVRCGARVYLYRGAFHHSKIMMIDDSVAWVGSANLNSRSLRWDYEASCIVVRSDVAARLSSVFEADKLHSDTLTHDRYKAIAPRRRWLGGVVDHLLTPVL